MGFIIDEPCTPDPPGAPVPGFPRTAIVSERTAMARDGTQHAPLTPPPMTTAERLVTMSLLGDRDAGAAETIESRAAMILRRPIATDDSRAYSTCQEHDAGIGQVRP